MTVKAFATLSGLAAALVGSCAHAGRPRPAVEQGAKAHDTWLAALPKCGPDEVAEAIEVGALRADDRDPTFVVRGILELGDNPACTLMDCHGGDDVCCNRCSGLWILRPRRPTEAAFPPPLSIHRAAEGEPMGWDAMDCDVASLQKAVTKAEVILTGKLRAADWRLVDATMCLVTPPAR